MPLPIAAALAGVGRAVAAGATRAVAAGATRAVAAGATRAAASGALRATVGEAAQAGIAQTARATAGRMAANPAMVQRVVRTQATRGALSGVRTGLHQAASGEWRGYTGSNAILGQAAVPSHLAYNFGPTGGTGGGAKTARSITRTMQQAAQGPGIPPTPSARPGEIGISSPASAYGQARGSSSFYGQGPSNYGSWGGSWNSSTPDPSTAVVPGRGPRQRPQKVAAWSDVSPPGSPSARPMSSLDSGMRMLGPGS